MEGELSCSRVNMVLASKFSFAFTILRDTPANCWIPPDAGGRADRHGGLSAQVKRHKPKPVGVRYEGGAGNGNRTRIPRLEGRSSPASLTSAPAGFVGMTSGYRPSPLDSASRFPSPLRMKDTRDRPQAVLGGGLG